MKLLILLLLAISSPAQTSVDHFSSVIQIENGVLVQNDPVRLTVVFKDEETITLYFFDSQIENYYQIGFINNRLKCLDKFGVMVEIAITENKLLIFYNKKKWREFQK